MQIRAYYFVIINIFIIIKNIIHFNINYSFLVNNYFKNGTNIN
jgi:hypothetical protein